jgi:glycosyltransferase involved in cell wall biosynthesis
MKEQIERLMTCPKEVLDKMEIIISDNCSTDDTQQIIENAISKGFVCRYIRNSENLGMDGNFVSCFKKASGRYVWLLGDDDTIIIDSLVKIVNILDVPQEYGLLHIYQKNDILDSTIYVTDKEQMVKYVSYYVTFISANIVNTKYVPMIDFEKYIGTWFTLVPLYLMSLTQEALNIIYTTATIEGGKDYGRNGGYNFYVVFLNNFFSIIEECVYSKSVLKYVKRDMWPFIWGHTKQLLIRKNIGNYKIENGWKILLKHYGYECYFWRTLLKYSFAFIKRKVFKK